MFISILVITNNIPKATLVTKGKTISILLRLRKIAVQTFIYKKGYFTGLLPSFSKEQKKYT